jgi:hypothetical protein
MRACKWGGAKDGLESKSPVDARGKGDCKMG